MTLLQPKKHQPLTYYLDLEQTIAATVKQETLFTWIVSPTVIFGRHQDMQQEVNVEYCRAHNVDIVQRKSGGGCVYADEGNLMVSFITPNTHSMQVFESFMHLLATALQQMSYDAVTTQHNDILVGGRKVCGTACYTTTKATIVHACMLYDVDLQALETAITPTKEKLLKHGVASVRQRVINLREIHDLGDMINFKAQLENTLCLNA